MRIRDGLRYCACAWLLLCTLVAAEYHGQVTFGGLPVPGATVTATQGDKKFTAITDPRGAYSFPDLADGVWTIQVEMQAFSPIKQEVTVAPGAPAAAWELKLAPLDQIKGLAAAPTPTPAAPAATTEKKKGRGKPVPTPENTAGAFQRPDLNAAGAAAPSASEATPPASDAFANQSPTELNQRASDGFLINGAANNGASSPFALNPAFGNNRRGGRSLYNFGLGLIEDNSALDARSYSLNGADTFKPAINNLTGLASVAGPLRIPHLIRNGPNFVITYQWTRDSTATTTPGLMPTAAERNGNFSGQPLQILDPTTGRPFPGNIIPQSRISPQAKALLNLYPLPNFSGPYNYQAPLVNASHQDAMQSRLNQTINRKDQLYGSFNFQSIRAGGPNLFNFLDNTGTLGINASINWRHAFTPRFSATFGYTYSYFSTRVTPYFDNRENISGLAGITGNNQDPLNWGPPALNFSDGTAGLTDGVPEFNRNQTGKVSYSSFWNHGRHNITFGTDFNRQEFNYFSQQNPRGAFQFTGAETGSAFADFLLGVPDTSSIAFGNADKYFRDSVYDSYFTDDWRISSGLTVNAGIRWEYGSPISELYGRLVNLDIAPGFAAVAPMVASNPVGPLTGQTYPSSLMRPDKHDFGPRLGLSWRPLPASSLVIRAGYGVYYNTSVYQSIAAQMMQQYPLSKSLSVPNSPADPLTLASGFNTAPGITPDTFGVDPNFLVGYVQTWQVAVQRDLPGALQMTASYLGIKGTRGMQEFYPNTYPIGGVNPCPTCPSGFEYLGSNGNSTREAGQIQLRRRLHNGFTATLQYTFSKSIDDMATLGAGNPAAAPAQTGANPFASFAPSTAPAAAIAQNWLNLNAERALSYFDQRHLLTVQLQYTTGMGLGGGTLLSGWRGALFKEWTFLTQITVGSGLPLTPVYPEAVNGTGFTGSLRPDYTGAPLYSAPPGMALNPAAYVAPAPGQWGNAGRDSITGPAEFIFNASMQRTFRVSDRTSLDVRVDATNILNHVVFTSWNTTFDNAQFGLPAADNPMRSMRTTLRLRF
jgi:hypothetical protein